MYHNLHCFPIQTQHTRNPASTDRFVRRRPSPTHRSRASFRRRRRASLDPPPSDANANANANTPPHHRHRSVRARPPRVHRPPRKRNETKPWFGSPPRAWVGSSLRTRTLYVGVRTVVVVIVVMLVVIVILVVVGIRRMKHRPNE